MAEHPHSAVWLPDQADINGSNTGRNPYRSRQSAARPNTGARSASFEVLDCWSVVRPGHEDRGDGGRCQPFCKAGSMLLKSACISAPSMSHSSSVVLSGMASNSSFPLHHARHVGGELALNEFAVHNDIGTSGPAAVSSSETLASAVSITPPPFCRCYRSLRAPRSWR